MCRNPDGAGCVPKHFCCYGAHEETLKWPVTVAGHQDQTHTVRPGEIQDLPRGIAVANDLRNRSPPEVAGQQRLKLVGFYPARLEAAGLLLLRVDDMQYRHVGVKMAGQDLCLARSVQ